MRTRHRGTPGGHTTPSKPNSPRDLFRVYLNSIIHNAWAARGGADGLGPFFPPGRSSELNSRVADLCRRCFLFGISYRRPLVTLAPAMFPCQPKMAGIVVVFCHARLRETRRESSPFFCRWRRRCSRFASVVRERNARALGGKSERGFLSRTRNYEGKATPRISECKK